MTISKAKSFWIRETPSGGTEYRAITKVLFAVLPLLVGVLVYLSLMVIDELPSGAEIIVYLAYGIIVLMAVLILLVVIVSIIDYLRRFE